MAKINVEERKLQNPDGTEFTLNLVTPGTGYGAIIMPIARFRGMPYVGLVQQWRETLQNKVYELPRGGTDDLSEKEAIREVAEETGYTPDNLRYVGMIAPDTGLLTTKVGVWIASYPHEVLTQDFSNPNENDLKLIWSSAPQAYGMLARQPVTCAMSLAAWTLVERTSALQTRP